MNTRAMKNETTEKILHKERMLKQKNASFEEILAELLPLIKGEQTKKVFKNGDLNAGVAPCGQTIGSINRILTVKEVIEGIIKGADSIIKRLNITTTPN